MVPFTAAWEEDDEDDLSFGPYLANKRRDSSKPNSGGTTNCTINTGNAKGSYKRPPTEKQINFAKSISVKLGIDLPNELTRQSLFLFIRDNKPKYECKLHNERVRDIAAAADNPEDPLDPDLDSLMMEAAGIDPYTGGFADNY